MLTIKEIIEYANLNGKKYEAYSSLENGFTFVMVNEEDGIYYWFKSHNIDEAGENERPMFMQRYNANKGTVIKASGTGERYVKHMIEVIASKKVVITKEVEQTEIKTTNNDNIMNNNTIQDIATYIRVSTVGQNTAIQEKDSKGKQYIDKISGVTPFNERPSGKQLLNDINNGTIKHVYVSRIDRLGRDADDIRATVTVFKKNKCQLTVNSLGLSLLDQNGKESTTFKIVLSVYAEMAENMRDEIKARTMEGIELAKKQGKFKGRVKGTVEDRETIINKPNNKKIIDCLMAGMSLSKTALIVGVSKTTVIKVKRVYGIEYFE